MQTYSDLEDRRIALSRELRDLNAVEADSRSIIDALIALRDAAGVSPDWAQPEPRGIDAHYATLVTALSGEGHMDGAARIAAATLVEIDDPDC